MIRIYLAAPLFSEAELAFNTRVEMELRKQFEVYLPQRDGLLLVELVKQGHDPASASKVVFDADMCAIRQCDLLLAVLDGRVIDEGVAFEIGVAYAIGKKAVGLQTDPRRLLPIGNNPMLSSALIAIYDSNENIVDLILSHFEPS